MRHLAKCFICVILFSPHNDPVKYAQLTCILYMKKLSLQRFDNLYNQRVCLGFFQMNSLVIIQIWGLLSIVFQIPLEHFIVKLTLVFDG